MYSCGLLPICVVLSTVFPVLYIDVDPICLIGCSLQMLFPT